MLKDPNPAAISITSIMAAVPLGDRGVRAQSSPRTGRICSCTDVAGQLAGDVNDFAGAAHHHDIRISRLAAGHPYLHYLHSLKPLDLDGHIHPPGRFDLLVRASGRHNGSRRDGPVSACECRLESVEKCRAKNLGTKLAEAIPRRRTHRSKPAGGLAKIGHSG
jgi:hypothetical protein